VKELERPLQLPLLRPVLLLLPFLLLLL